MDRSENKKQQWTELVNVLQKILDGQTGFTEGCRAVTAFRFILDKGYDPLFLSFVGYDDVTDAFPMGEVRKLWSEDGLAKMDNERKKVEEFYKEWMLQSAKELLAHAIQFI